MQTGNDKILDKISKILNIFNDNPDTEEAKVALMKAQKLAAKHGLDISDIDFDKELKSEPIVDNGITEYQNRRPMWEKRLAGIIADNFRCFYYNSSFVSRTFNGIKYSNKTRTIIRFVGRTTDVTIAKKVYAISIQYIKDSFNTYYKNNEAYYLYSYPADQLKNKTKFKAGIKNAYIDGFLNGLSIKFSENIKENDLNKLANEASSTTTSLMLVKDSELELFYNDFSKDFKRSKPSSGIPRVVSDDISAKHSGYLAGYSYGSDPVGDDKLTNS